MNATSRNHAGVPPSIARRKSFEICSMACPVCGSRKTHCVDSRVSANGKSTRRRKVCLNGHRFTTREMIEPDCHAEWSAWEI